MALRPTWCLDRRDTMDQMQSANGSRDGGCAPPRGAFPAAVSERAGTDIGLPVDRRTMYRKRPLPLAAYSDVQSAFLRWSTLVRHAASAIPVSTESKLG